MTNSNDRKNITGDDADDLIAELARIVADDAQRSSVAQSINERAENPSNFQEAESTFDDNPQDAPENIAPFPLHDRNAQAREEAFTPMVEQRASHAAPANLSESRPAANQTPESSLGDGFEFDFSENIQKGPSSTVTARFEQQQEAVEEVEPAAFEDVDQVQDIADSSQSQETVDADELDGIASLIEEVERQSAQPEPEPFEPVPVAVAQTQAVASSNPPQAEPSQIHQRVDDFSYLPEQDVDVPAGEDEFAIPPSNDAEDRVYEDHKQVKDALAEIESLIADTKPPAQAQPQKAPADAAEAAILAALGAARAESGMQAKTQSAPQATRQPSAVAPQPRSEPRFDVADTPTARDRVADSPKTSAPNVGAQKATQPAKKVQEPRKAKVERDDERRGGMMPVIASVAAVLLLAAVGGGAYWMFTSQSSDGEVPVVAAQNTEVKQQPEPTPTSNESTVFNALEGNSEDTGNEQLVPRDETVSTDGTAPRVITPSSTSNGLTNRKVKTVTVLADGTIVTGEEASAGAEQLPSDVRPNAPVVTTGGETDGAPTDEITNVLNSIVAQSEGGQPETPATDTATTETQTEPLVEEQVETTEPVVADASAPVPPIRPQGLGTNQPLASAVLATPQQTTPAPSTQTEAPISLLPSSNSSSASAPVANSNVSSEVQAPFYVQLSSQRSVEAAQSTASTLLRQYGSVLGGAQLDINRVNLGDRGIYYRVRVPANSLSDANNICSNIKASGGDCFVYSN